MRNLAFAAPVIALMAVSSAALAQPAADPTGARILFEQGAEDLKRGDWIVACAKFQASLELAPAVSVLVNIARCREHEGKLALAYDAYQRAIALNRETEGKSRKDELEAYTKKALEELVPRIPRLRIVVPARPEGLVVRRDGSAIPENALGTALPIDPGEHVITLDAHGYRHVARTVTLAEGTTIEIALPLKALEVVDTASPTAEVASPARAPSVVTPVDRSWAYALGAVGVVALGVGVGFGADALSASSTIDGCKQTPRCGPADGLSAADVSSLNSRKDVGRVLSGAFGGVGAAAVAVGIYGITRTPNRLREAHIVVSPWAAPGAKGLAVQGEL